MTLRNHIVLFVIALALLVGVASMQRLPGYLDADYYFAGGLQLVEGKGFSEPYLWNYLDDPAGIPHPSHTYWLPLASVLAAFSMALSGLHTYAGARLIFILVAASVPGLTGSLAFTMTRHRALACTSGLLAVFSVYHIPFLPVTDNFGLYMLLGGVYFLFALREEKYIPFLLGLLAGLLNLARSDGLLWLGLTGFLLFWKAISKHQNIDGQEHRTISWWPVIMFTAKTFALALFGYLLVMGPWYARNFGIFGSVMAPGADRLLWLTNYNDTFAFPADKVNLQAWLLAGWQAAVRSRLWALRTNVLNAFAAQGGILLFPFVLLGLWQFRRDLRVRLAVTGWVILLFVVTVVFPFAGARGTFFHAGAAFQPLWWAVAPVGLEHLTRIVRGRNWFNDQAYAIFRAALVGICALLTVYIIWLRIVQPGWQPEAELYIQVEQFLAEEGINSNEIVIVRNPVGYYIVSGRSAIVMPPGGPETILSLAERYGATYFVLEPGGVLEEYQTLYEKMETNPGLALIGDVEGARIYALYPAK